MNKRWPDRFVVGLTGNIATGKSVVMRLAAEQGALAIDADEIVREILEDDPSMQAAIEAAFGPEVRRPDGRIDRAALGDIVFSDPDALRDLELLVHPAVRKVLLERVEASQARVVFIEAIKLLESGLVYECDQLWVTRCPRDKQIQRLVVCRGMDDKTAASRVDAQSPQEDKVALADVVIDTDGTMADTLAYFELSWDRLQQSLPAIPTPREFPKFRTVPPPAGPLVAQATSPAATRAAAPEADSSKEEPAPEPAPPEEESPDGISVRRARPADIPAILLLIRRATGGKIKLKRAELLLALGERGYLIGQEGIDISTVAGWSSQNLVARIDQIFVDPPGAAQTVGSAVLDEIERSANQLICEAILAFPPVDALAEIRTLFADKGFEAADVESLPPRWRAAVTESRPDGSDVLMKVLRDIRLQ